MDKLDELLLDGSNIPMLAAEYFEQYQVVKEIEADLKKNNEMLEVMKQELIDAMDGLSVKSVELYSGEVRIIRSSRQFTKVTDYNKLCTFISDVLNEPLSAYGVFKFENSKLKPLVDEAKVVSLSENRPLEEVLPYGLELSTTNIITVTTKKE